MQRSVIGLLIGLTCLLPRALAADRTAGDILAARPSPAALVNLPPDLRVDRFVPYTGVARSAAWLEQYTLAQRIYRESLAQAQNDDERLAAASGLANMLTALDHAEVGLGAVFPGTPRSLSDPVQAARAALSAPGEGQSRLMLDAKPAKVTIEIAESYPGRTPAAQPEDLGFRNGPRLTPPVEYVRDDNLRVYDVLLKAALSPQSGQAPLGIVGWDMMARYQALDAGSLRKEVPQIQSGVTIKASDHVKLLVSAAAPRQADGATRWRRPSSVTARRPSGARRSMPSMTR
jgi:hypothetical protein